MDKDFLKGIKIALGIIFTFSILGLVYAVGFHIADEVLSGTFTGDFSFNGTVNFTGAQVSGFKLSDNATLCQNSTLGSIRYNTANNSIEACNGDFWFYISNAQYFTTCKEILDNGQSVGDGIYTIDPDGSGPISSLQVYCDMTSNSGGWILLLSATDPKAVSNTNATPTDPSSSFTTGFMTPEDLGYASGEGDLRFNCNSLYAIIDYSWNMSAVCNGAVSSSDTTFSVSSWDSYSCISRASSTVRSLTTGGGYTTSWGRYQPANDVLECNNGGSSGIQTMWFRED